jgi:hypothetical protein
LPKLKIARRKTSLVKTLFISWPFSKLNAWRKKLLRKNLLPLHIKNPLPSWIKQLSEKHAELVEKKIEATKNHEIFPTGFVVASLHSSFKSILKPLTFLMSLTILAFMLYDSFFPEAKLSSFWVWVLLLPSFIIPSVAFYLHSLTVKLAEAAIARLEKQIREAQRKQGEESV